VPAQPGGTGGLLARVLGEGESPSWWGLPLARVWGCEVRVHLVAVVFVGAALAYGVWNGPSVPFVGTGLAAFALVVVIHEAVRGHVLVRWSGLRPGSVTLWPLGAVWEFGGDAGPGARARGEGLAAGMGCLALVGVVVAAGLAARWLMGDWSVLWFDITNPAAVMLSPAFSTGSTGATVGRLAVWNAYAAAVFVLAANLLPMLPLDAGVLVRAAADRGPGSTVAPRVGLIVATVLVAGGLLTGLVLAAAVGVCGGVVCWQAWQAQRFAIDPAGVDRWREVLGGETGEGAGPIPAEDRAAVERILEKISRRGMGSLTRAERRELQRATERLGGGAST
jgi:hypothetical protein